MRRYLASTALAVVLAACTYSTPPPPSPPPPSATPAGSPVAKISGSVVASADGRHTFSESGGAFVVDYPSTWQGGSQDHFRIVNATPGFPKATLEIFPNGKQSYQVPPTAPTLQIPTGFGTLTAYRFKAPDVYGGAPYYAEVISTRFRAGGRDWAVEAVLLEQRREEMLAIVLDLLRTLRPG
ncbi:MAG: hypothetical protein ACRDGT_07825 [Candidatus Limnocylindria bacterium]